MIYDVTTGNSFGTSIWNGIKGGFGIGTIAGAIIGGIIGGAAAASVTGLTNVAFWTNLGSNGATIAANEASKFGLTTLGQTFGGKAVQSLTNIVGNRATKYLWASLSKTMSSTISMSSTLVFYGGTVSSLSIYATIEEPILTALGVQIIKMMVGGL